MEPYARDLGSILIFQNRSFLPQELKPSSVLVPGMGIA